MSDEDEISQAGRNWLRTMNESRENCREKVAEAMVVVRDPTKCLWPAVQGPRMSSQHRSAIEAHVSVIDYADQIEPYADENVVQDEELWEETVHEIDFSGKRMKISLDTLNQWEFRFVQNKVQAHDELQGKTETVEQNRLLLPVTGSRECYRQLNKIVKALGFAAESNADSLPKGKMKTPQPGR